MGHLDALEERCGLRVLPEGCEDEHQVLYDGGVRLLHRVDECDEVLALCVLADFHQGVRFHSIE